MLKYVLLAILLLPACTKPKEVKTRSTYTLVKCEPNCAATYAFKSDVAFEACTLADRMLSNRVAFHNLTAPKSLYWYYFCVYKQETYEKP